MDKKLMTLMVVFFLVFLVFVTTILFNKQISNLARASTETDPSAQTSLIFAWPLTAKVGDKVDINVFVRSINNSPLDKKQVRLVTNLGLINGAQESTAESDKAGRVNFVLSSGTQGIAELTTFVNGNTQLKQKVTVKFE